MTTAKKRPAQREPRPPAQRPTPSDLVRETYEHLPTEILEAGYTDEEITMLRDPVFYYGRFLNDSTRAYSLNAIGKNIVPAIKHLGLPNEEVRIVDLGCGLGMQSIIFAQLGAQVLGLDLQPQCIDLCRKRQAYWEERCGRPLKMEFLAGDFLETDLTGYSGYDGLFSMSAFAHIRPLEETVRRIAGLLRDRAGVYLWDLNPGFLLTDALGRNTSGFPTTREITLALEQHGFRDHKIRGGTSVPHKLWTALPLHSWWKSVDDVLTRSLTLSFSYVVQSQRDIRP